MSIAEKTIAYDIDFCKWVENQLTYLKNKEFNKLDLDNLIEEVGDLGKREKQRLTSYLEKLMMHLLKVKYQPAKHTRSWDLTIKESKYKAEKILSENPSLKSRLSEIFDEAYFIARIKAAKETGLDECIFPKDCVFNVKEIFNFLDDKYYIK